MGHRRRPVPRRRCRPSSRCLRRRPSARRPQERRRPRQVSTLAAPAPASLPYTVYFGNLHSQTNHSDGGGALATCTGAQNPQSAPLGPTDAYNYAMNKGLDILMTSEHNHMYDGSDSTNTRPIRPSPRRCTSPA